MFTVPFIDVKVSVGCKALQNVGVDVIVIELN